MVWLATLAAAAAGAGTAGDLEQLERLWTGLHDSTEQRVVSSDRGLVGWAEGVEHRVRTVIAPVNVPSLGPHVLYLEEFLQDEPDELRRQVLLQLKPQGPPEAAVRVHMLSFVQPARWAHLDRRQPLAQQLNERDLVASPGCDLVLRRDGDQFTGGTIGHSCSDALAPNRYVDYQIVIGPNIYWYHRRVLARPGDEVREEVIGYNWFELNEATLFTCRIDWSATGRAADLKPLERLELRDAGGRAQFSTPDGHTFELALHGQDWPFLGERDALILLVQELGGDAGASGSRAGPVIGSAWSEIDTQQISLQLDWLRVRCGPLVPDTDELTGALGRPALSAPDSRRRATAPG